MIEAEAAKAPRRRRVREALPDTPDAVEIAMAAVASGRPLPDVARKVLEKHTSLIDAQVNELRLKHVVERLRVTFWSALAVLGLGLVVTLGTMLWRASTSDALVVEPFRVPPALDNAGLSGEVMATRVMDQIALMQSRTLSTRPASSFSTDWGDDIKVALPNTSATLGDLRRLLRSWLGRETRISGEAVRENGAWTVTARVTGYTAIRAKGLTLEPLLAQVAEGVFRQTQPFRYVVYLAGQGRNNEAIAAARDLMLNGPEAERPWGVVAYANALSYPQYGEVERLEPTRRAMEAVPDFPMPARNHASRLANLGRWEEALAVYQRADELVGDGEKISDEFRGPFVKGGTAYSDGLKGAFMQAARQLEAAGNSGTPVYAVQYVRGAANNYFAAHDVRSAARNLARLDELTGFNSRTPITMIGASDAAKQTLAFRIYNEVARAKAIGDAAWLQRELPDRVAKLEAIQGSLDGKQARDFGLLAWPSIAGDLARLGRVAEAEGMLASLPLDCYPCLVARGEVAAAKGDRTGAIRWFAKAKAAGPSLPFADEALGRMWLAAGNPVAAAKAFEAAHNTEPRYADAAKGWGDALLQQRQCGKAAERYEDAAANAPAWGVLYIAWAQALRCDGDAEGARAKLKVAASRVLSAADRGRLVAMGHRS